LGEPVMSTASCPEQKSQQLYAINTHKDPRLSS
jgi:hypothetical protein